MIKFTESNERIVFSVRVIPRSSKTEVVGEHDGVLKIKLRSPPINGAANNELIRFLSKTLNVSRSDVEIISGQTARLKLVSVSGITREQIVPILPVKI